MHIYAHICTYVHIVIHTPTPGVSDGQGGLAYCRPQGHKQSDMTERLN